MAKTVIRGAARRARREDMQAFRANREKQKAALPANTHWCNFAPTQRVRQSISPHLHDVAAVVDIGAGFATVTTYESTTDYPANSVCPHRNIKYRYGIMSKGAALQIAARINQPVA